MLTPENILNTHAAPDKRWGFIKPGSTTASENISTDIVDAYKHMSRGTKEAAPIRFSEFLEQGGRKHNPLDD